ncbi:12832_t:CDS:2, partial [Ambispora leptoticha]
EYAGLGGNVNFIKHELESQINYNLGKGFIFSASLRNGLLYPLDGKPSKISDRFFLGGVQSIRGFKLNGIGPIEDRKDSLGGDIYIAGGASLFTPLPRIRRLQLKGHLFINGGNLVQLNQRLNLYDNIQRLKTAPSVATGFGIVYRSSLLRFELNFCLPLIATTTDKVKKGFQLGLGFNFW